MSPHRLDSSKGGILVTNGSAMIVPLRYRTLQYKHSNLDLDWVLFEKFKIELFPNLYFHSFHLDCIRNRTWTRICAFR